MHLGAQHFDALLDLHRKEIDSTGDLGLRNHNILNYWVGSNNTVDHLAVAEANIKGPIAAICRHSGANCFNLFTIKPKPLGWCIKYDDSTESHQVIEATLTSSEGTRNGAF